MSDKGLFTEDPLAEPDESIVLTYIFSMCGKTSAAVVTTISMMITTKTPGNDV